jgi:hypothetical protein
MKPHALISRVIVKNAGIVKVGVQRIIGDGILWRIIVAVLLVVFVGIVVYNAWNVYMKPIYSTNRITREGFNSDNNEYIYYPKKYVKNTDIKCTFKINDFMQEAIEVPECVKVYNNLIYTHDPSANTITNNGEYSKPIEESNLYKKYINDIKPNETKSLDKMYGDMFDTTKISGLELSDIQKIVTDKLTNTNLVYTLVKYLTISKVDAEYLPVEFSAYFATLINAYKSQSGQLDLIKTFLYKIIGPSFTHAKLIEHYTSNSSLYSSTDDILFILNTTKEYLQNVKMEDLEHTPSPKNTVYVFKDDANNFDNKTFTVDSLTIFAMVSLLMNIYPLIDNIAERNVIDKPTNKKVKLTTRNLFGILDAYLKKKMAKTKDSPPSVIVFALNPDNRPDLPK